MNEILRIMRKPIKQARNSWDGETGKQRAKEVKKIILEVADNYSNVLGLTKLEVIKAIEDKRTYSSINYYQKANFPKLKDDVIVYENQKELHEKIQPKRGFRCPSCGGISKDPYTCDSGEKNSDGKICDWKAYGLFGTMGKGLRFTVKDMFLENPRVDEIFMPIHLEELKIPTLKEIESVARDYIMKKFDEKLDGTWSFEVQYFGECKLKRLAIIYTNKNCSKPIYNEANENADELFKEAYNWLKTGIK